MISDWIDEWLEIGFECHRDFPFDRVPLRASIAHFLVYRLGLWKWLR